MYLAELVAQLGAWVYIALFATIFAETGLVVTPFLPGESLLLTSGTLAGGGLLTIGVLAPLLFLAAFLGDVCNYLIGRFLGRHLLSKPRRYLKPKHVAAAQRFYERHGGLAIVLARFLPVVRTLAPFVAGAAGMPLRRLLFLRGRGLRSVGDGVSGGRLLVRHRPVGPGPPRLGPRRPGHRLDGARRGGLSGAPSTGPGQTRLTLAAVGITHSSQSRPRESL